MVQVMQEPTRKINAFRGTVYDTSRDPASHPAPASALVQDPLCTSAGKALKSLGDGFIALIKMMIAPVIFCTVVHGISSMGDLKRIGRAGLKSPIYFETVSTVALVVISISEGELDRDALHETMAHPLEIGEALEPGGGA